MDEPPTPTDVRPSPLLKSRVPRKTIIVDHNLFRHDEESRIYDLHCPLRKGIICYRRDGAIFEHNIHSSGKHEPRIIVPKHPSQDLAEISFVPIKDNRVLLFAKYFGKTTSGSFLHLSIYEIRADNRVGPVMWCFSGDVGGRFNIFDLGLIKSTENALGITFGARFNSHWKLFDISTTETDASDNFPLIESGKIDFDIKLKSKSVHDKSLVTLSPDRRILLNADFGPKRHNEMIDIHYLDSGGTSNMKFSFITRMSIPIPGLPEGASIFRKPLLAFSADGSKFAMAMSRGGVSVWDIRSKASLKTFTKVPKFNYYHKPVWYLQFSSGRLGKEVLVFVERKNLSSPEIIHVINATSLETEEILLLNLEELGKTGMYKGVGALFFDPSGGTLYAEIDGAIYEWDLQKNKHDPEWWIGE